MPGTATRRFVSATDEGALIRAARTDPRAFADLYHCHVSAIDLFCYRRLGTKEAAEDATAQVFTKALGGLAGYRGGSFRGWLLAIAYHVVVDEVRLARWDAPLTAATASIDPDPGPEEVAIDAEARPLDASGHHPNGGGAWYRWVPPEVVRAPGLRARATHPRRRRARRRCRPARS